MLIFKCGINFSNIIKGVKIIIIFPVGFFNVMPIIEKKRIIRALNARILSLKAKFTMLNKFAIVLQLD